MGIERRTGHALRVDLLLFEEVGDALRGLIPAELGVQRQRVHRYGIKLWFDAVKPPASTTRPR